MEIKNVVVKQDCHSRMLLSGIPTLATKIVYRLGVSPTGAASKPWNVCCLAGKLSGSHPTYKGYFGFTARCVIPQCFYAGYSGRRGFTLIELLVVVLIIGILAAVAVPQYQIAVAKSKYMKLVSVMASLRAAEELYYLANGEYIDDTTVLDIGSLAGCSNMWAGTIRCQDFSIDINAGIAFGNPMGSMRNTLDGLHYVYFQNHSSTNPGERECWAQNEFAQKVCKSLGGIENGTRRWQDVRAFTRYSLP